MRRLRGDRGAATSLAVALLTPMFVFLAFAAFQAAMWSHARTEARVIARDTAALVARSGVAPGDAQASATAILEADTDRALIDAGRRLVVVADHTKWGVIGISSIARLDQADILITDRGIGEPAGRALDGAVRELVVVDPASSEVPDDGAT